ncbi:hypothetical protein DYH09_10780 [bacterium CPR1]|nr:hypothetical protein [bacterium CPR1]
MAIDPDLERLFPGDSVRASPQPAVLQPQQADPPQAAQRGALSRFMPARFVRPGRTSWLGPSRAALVLALAERPDVFALLSLRVRQCVRPSLPFGSTTEESAKILRAPPRLKGIR